MAAFATPAQLGARLGVELTAAEETRAQTLLDMASGLIRRETGQTIDRVTDDVLTRRGHPASRLRLPQRPVVSVASVTVDGDPVDATDYYLLGDELVRRAGYGWGAEHQEMVVTYTHGFDPLPDEVVVVCLESAVRVWVNPGNVRQEVYGSEQVMHEPRNGLLLTDQERAVLSSAIRRGVGTVQLR